VVLIFAFCFFFGWVFGQLFLVLPWIGLGVVAITCGSLALAGSESGEAAGFAAYLGLGMCIIMRLSYSFVLQRTGKVD
jgi:hypothetical protein